MSKQAAGGFTLPGEAGHEKLTLQLAKRWDADMIRDSDGTHLSDDILRSGYGIYSTLCVIRNHNQYIRAHPQYRQQSFLMTPPATATGDTLSIELLEAFFEQQFSVNDTEESLALWQVFNRTTGAELRTGDWHYDGRRVLIKNPVRWHQYTVNFLAWRVWEEISMYNHITNDWQGEHLMQLDPRHPQAADYLCEYLEQWCRENPCTKVVRFTSLFYNFAWVWGSNPAHRNLYTDWGSYDFTVSPLALRQFEAAYGYKLTSEDFINGGRLHPCHMPASQKQLDYIAFINDFVVSLGRRMVDIVHRHNKQAYLFYDDSWVGAEPGGERFAEMGFDGLIKCVFSAYEARLCSAVSAVPVHELRLHPYLFPVGLNNRPTFAPGGTPGSDALAYWAQVRRALLRQPVERIGLGGYLHYVEEYPDFAEAVDRIVEEFRLIRALHAADTPQTLPIRVGILTTWGRLRRWTCGGHYHEHPDLDLLNLMESLAGMPCEVDFYSFEDIRQGVPAGVQVLVSAGFAGSAWSGGDAWEQPEVVEGVTAFVHRGGTFLGVNQPAALPARAPVLRTAHLLGVDLARPELLCHSFPELKPASGRFCGLPPFCGPRGPAVFPTSGHTFAVQPAGNDAPLVTGHHFGRGMGIYLSAYRHCAANTMALHQLLLAATGLPARCEGLADNPNIECALFAGAKKAVLINGAATGQAGTVRLGGRDQPCRLPPYGLEIVDY